MFCRYLHIEDKRIPVYIDDAAGKKTDRNSEGYNKAYTRVLQWRENWFFVFFSQVEALQVRLESDNLGYASLRVDELREAYAKIVHVRTLLWVHGAQ